MERCNGPGKWFGEGMEEWTAEHNAEEDNELETEEDEETDELAGQDARRELMSHMERGESLPAINCSPVTVIYGHAGGSPVLAQDTKSEYHQLGEASTSSRSVKAWTRVAL